MMLSHRSKRPWKRDVDLMAHYSKSRSIRETGKAFGLSPSRVHQIIQRDYPYLMAKPHDGRPANWAREKAAKQIKSSRRA